jgi:pilus assembly protein CpaE
VSTGDRDRVRVYLTGSCDGIESLQEALVRQDDLELIGSSEQIASSLAALAEDGIDVVLHATRSASPPANELAVIRELTHAPILLLASAAATELLDGALEAGAVDVLLLPQPAESIAFAIRKACRAGGGMLARGGPRGRVLTVFSPKGGTGKTVISTNLASELAKGMGKRTLLLDLDLQFGDAAIMLGLEPERTIFDLIVAPGELDADKLAAYTSRHPTGLEVLPAPLRPEDAELVTEGRVGQLLETARLRYEVIVVDTSPFFHGPMLSTLDQTDELLLVTCLDVPTLKNVRLGLQTLELLSFPSEHVRVVLNRAGERVGLGQRQVEEALEGKVKHAIPFDRAVPLAVNRGAPVTLTEPGSDFARGVRAMAAALCGERTSGKKRLLGVFSA